MPVSYEALHGGEMGSTDLDASCLRSEVPGGLVKPWKNCICGRTVHPPRSRLAPSRCARGPRRLAEGTCSVGVATT